MGELLAGVPEPLTDLDHVPATAATVLDRVRYLHAHYELERCRVLLLGDHDATSLAFGALGAPVRELAVVDVDQRQLRYLAALRRRHVVRRPARRAAGAAARALRHRPHRPAVLARGRRPVRGAGARGDEARVAAAVAYGYPEGSPALGLKVQAELSALELVYEALLPDFNAYDGALASARARRCTCCGRPSARARSRCGGASATREALYTRGRQAVESGGGRRARLPRRVRGRGRRAYFGAGCKRPLRELLDAPRPAPTVVVNLAPDLVYSLYQAAVAAVAERVLIVAHNHTEGLRSAAEQARLRAVVAPRYEVVAARPLVARARRSRSSSCAATARRATSGRSTARRPRPDRQRRQRRAPVLERGGWRACRSRRRRPRRRRAAPTWRRCRRSAPRARCSRRCRR